MSTIIITTSLSMEQIQTIKSSTIKVFIVERVKHNVHNTTLNSIKLNSGI